MRHTGTTRPAGCEGALKDLTSREALAALRQAVHALPLRYREVVVLCHLQGLEYREAAGILECVEGTVCSRLSRARALLVEKLRGQGICPISAKTNGS